MPPKNSHVDPHGDSEDDMAHIGGGAPGFDPSRFTNPNYSREFLATLPSQIRKRVNALLGLDKKYVELRKDYENKRNAAYLKFEQEVAAPLYQERKAIVAGDAAVNDDQVQDGLPQEHIAAEIDTKAPAQANNKDDNLSGFWLKALQRHVIINDMITEKDAAVLKYVTDISCASLAAPANGFTVRFEFAPNDFFKNTFLSKTFHLKEIFDELTVERVEGTKVEWTSKDKDTTVEIVTKKQKAKVKGKVVHRTIEKSQPCESFFRFFNEGSISGEGGEERDEDDEEAFEDMDEDQWLGLAHVLRDKIVPYAVEYFTGEAPDGSSDLEDDDEEFGEEGEEEEEEDEDEPPVMMAGRGRGGAPRGKNGGAGAGGRGGAQQPGGKMTGAQQDCKQQ